MPIKLKIERASKDMQNPTTNTIANAKMVKSTSTEQKPHHNSSHDLFTFPFHAERKYNLCTIPTPGTLQYIEKLFEIRIFAVS